MTKAWELPYPCLGHLYIIITAHQNSTKSDFYRKCIESATVAGFVKHTLI